MMSSALNWATEGILDPTVVDVKRLSPARGVDRIERINPVFLRILLRERLNEGLKVVSEPTSEKLVRNAALVSLDGATVFRLLPPVPDATSDATMQAQSQLVADAYELRSDRLQEIYLQQWDMISFLGATTHVNVISQKWLLELLQAVQEAAMVNVAQVKHIVDVARPVHLFPGAAPVVQTPQHSTIPSGHAAEGFTVAYVLSRLLGRTDAETVEGANNIFRMAARIATNRTVAGVHFPMDSMAGACLGLTLGRIFWRRLAGDPDLDGAPACGGFNIDAQDFGAQDFNLSEFLSAAANTGGAGKPWLLQRYPVPYPPAAAISEELDHIKNVNIAKEIDGYAMG